uniref:Ovule protein n=1 Tax=Rodentolepis nana TaxID=102285 RepID=A0A0R3TQS5_RODNA
LRSTFVNAVCCYHPSIRLRPNTIMYKSWKVSLPESQCEYALIIYPILIIFIIIFFYDKLFLRHFFELSIFWGCAQMQIEECRS